MSRSWVLATHNRGKADEFQRLLAPLDVTLELSYLAADQVVEETGATYLENARLKALHAARVTGRPTLADDSGIEVDALGGRPGLHSARYVSTDGWENLRAVLMETLAVPFAARTCRMRAVVVLALPDGSMTHAEGLVEGHLASYPRGVHGFGYDPAFLLDDGRTMAELTPEEKDGVSHRGRAARALIRLLEQRPGGCD
ncbi:MAG: RdgB/HAM1 family non-canonical purine NTP pyrophosphatase [Clostridia bacterium]